MENSPVRAKGDQGRPWYRRPLPAVVAVASGALCVALTSGCEATTSSPSPNTTAATSATATTASGDSLPSCTIAAKVSGEAATFTVKTKNDFRPGVYTLGAVEYNFGDGKTKEGDPIEPHRYAAAGTYVASADLKMDIAPGVEPPFKSSRIDCEAPVTVTIP